MSLRPSPASSGVRLRSSSFSSVCVAITLSNVGTPAIVVRGSIAAGRGPGKGPRLHCTFQPDPTPSDPTSEMPAMSDPTRAQAPASDPAKRHSAALTDGPDRAGARSMLKAIGFTDEDLAKPLIGVGTTCIETTPCDI